MITTMEHWVIIGIAVVLALKFRVPQRLLAKLGPTVAPLVKQAEATAIADVESMAEAELQTLLAKIPLAILVTHLFQRQEAEQAKAKQAAQAADLMARLTATQAPK